MTALLGKGSTNAAQARGYNLLGNRKQMGGK
jgi:hypothetical protein